MIYLSVSAFCEIEEMRGRGKMMQMLCKLLSDGRERA